jgi:hypothetical protein
MDFFLLTIDDFYFTGDSMNGFNSVPSSIEASKDPWLEFSYSGAF